MDGRDKGPARTVAGWGTRLFDFLTGSLGEVPAPDRAERAPEDRVCRGREPTGAVIQTEQITL